MQVGRRDEHEKMDSQANGGAAKRAKLSPEEESPEGAEGAPMDAEEEEAKGDEGDTDAPVAGAKVTGARTSPAAGSARRTLRPRQAAVRGGRTKTRSKDDKPPVMQYREGEPLQDLHKYLGETPEESVVVEVCIPASAVTSSNRQVRARQLWGTNVYTDDSDLVAVLMHTGYYLPCSSQPPPAIVELRAFVRPLPPQDGYDSKARNSIRSRAWGAARSGCSYHIDGCKAITPAGLAVDLDASVNRAPAAVPTFVQSAEARVLNTRSAANNQERRQRFVQEVTLQYNLCNEPWLKYSMNAVADRGLNMSQLTSARLRKEVLFLETHAERYELSCDHWAVAEPPEEDDYKWVKCKKPHTLTALQQLGLPLPAEETEPMYDKIKWEGLRWSNAGVQVNGKFFAIVRLQFMPRKKMMKP